VFRLDEDHLGLYVLDVSGHGVPAALLSVTLSRVLSPLMDQSQLLKHRLAEKPYYQIVEPVEVAKELNRRFQMQPHAEQYFTFLYGILEVKTRTLRYVSAGHPGPVQLSRGREPIYWEKPGFPIGWLDDVDYEESVLQLAPGDRFVLYSDGITEAANDANEQFGIQRLIESLRDSSCSPLRDAIADLRTRVEQWSSGAVSDDLSILAIEFAE
jgi:sigma-B regulation protein RsbU (phosphoserine phosphatase)